MVELSLASENLFYFPRAVNDSNDLKRALLRAIDVRQ